MMPKRYYRYGVASEKRLFDMVSGCSDGYVLPAHLVVDQRDSLSPWLANKEFCIDPMTHVWFSHDCDLSNSSGNDLKRSYRKIRDEYGSVFSSISTPETKLSVQSLLESAKQGSKELDEMIASVIDYQVNFVHNAYWDSEIEEYFRILRSTGSNAKGLDRVMDGGARIVPSKVVLPYVYFTNMDTPEYELTKEIWARAAKSYDGDVPLQALVATDDPGLDWERLLDDLGSGIHGATLWFSDVEEATAQKDQLVDVRRACQVLSGDGYEVCLHSGGAFSMGLGFDGLKAMSSGITYGERRPAGLVEGGPVPQRYFIPQLLRSYALGETVLVLKKMGIECKNPCCEGIETVDQLVAEFFPGGETSWGPVESAKRHYLYSFRQKTSDIWASGKSAGIDALNLMQQHASRYIQSSYWKHLETWAKAYEEPI